MFLELALAYQELKYKRTALEVVNNTVRNASVVSDDSDVQAVRLSFSPTPTLQLSLAYQKQDREESSKARSPLRYIVVVR